MVTMNRVRRVPVRSLHGLLLVTLVGVFLTIPSSRAFIINVTPKCCNVDPSSKMGRFWSPLARIPSIFDARITTATKTSTNYLQPLKLYAKPKNKWKSITQQQDDDDDASIGVNCFIDERNDLDPIDIMPANLKRKVYAKRPTLGHVVPSHLKFKTKGTATSTTVSSGGSSIPILRPQGKSRDTPRTVGHLNNPSLLKILGGSVKGRRLESPQVYLRPMMGKVKEAVFSSFQSMGLYSLSHSSSKTATSTNPMQILSIPPYANTKPAATPRTVTSTTNSIRHLDIFCGSGSVGLESLSRGASHCTFVDWSSDCCDTVARNFQSCFGTSEQQTSIMTKSSQIVCADYLNTLRDPASVGMDPSIPFHIVTLCPPYEEVIYAELLDAVANSPLVGEDTVVLVEYPVELQTLPHVLQRRQQSQNVWNQPNPGGSATNSGGGGALIGIRNRRYGRTVIAMYVCNPTGKLQGAESRPEEFV